ncbi:MAG: molecular chaperone TorD family protein [Pirellulales bacterium]
MSNTSHCNSAGEPSINSPPPGDRAIDLAVETLYRFLAATFSDPEWGTWPMALEGDNQRLAESAADLLRSEYGDVAIPLGFAELPVEQLTLRSLVTELNRGLVEWRDGYTRVFGFAMCRDCPPYETEYCPDEDPFFRSQEMADVAGFYRAFGLASGARSRERPDHLALELEFAAFLIMKERCAADDERMDVERAAQDEQATICREGRAAFLGDHLAWWAPSFARAVRRKAGGGMYAAAADVLAALLPIERYRLRVAAPQIPTLAAPAVEPDGCDGCLVELKT